MYNTSAHTIDSLYCKIGKALYTEGKLVSPRGMTTRELSPVALTLELPNANILMNLGRKASKAFMGAELLWILAAREGVKQLAFYNKNMLNFSDDGKTLAGAYGPRLMNQFAYVFNTLQTDPNSRQAVITIWTPNPAPSKDIPCTVMLHFLIRDRHLDLMVYMRSNDFWLGLPYDIHNFTCIQILFAKLLQVNTGRYHHFVGSLHLYEQNFEACRNMPTTTCSGLTPDPNFTTITQFYHDLQEAMSFENDLRFFYDHDFQQVEAYVTPEILNFRNLFFKQKLVWLLEKARSKHETKHR